MIVRRGWLIIALCLASLVAIAHAKLPRGFTEGMYCSACKEITKEIFDEIEKDDGSNQVETGSYRVDSTGKQKWKKKIPYKRSTLHVETVFETICPRMTREFRKSKSGDYFVRMDPSLEGGDDADLEHSSKHQLTNICNNFVDDEHDTLIELARKYESEDELSLQICGNLFKACKLTDFATDKTEL